MTETTDINATYTAVKSDIPFASCAIEDDLSEAEAKQKEAT